MCFLDHCGGFFGEQHLLPNRKSPAWNRHTPIRTPQGDILEMSERQKKKGEKKKAPKRMDLFGIFPFLAALTDLMASPGNGTQGGNREGNGLCSLGEAEGAMKINLMWN